MSVSIQIKPADSRCRFWAKLLRAGVALPLPSAVECAANVPGGFARIGDEEIFAGDFLIEGEQAHHRKMRGWDYCVTWVDSSGAARRLFPDSATKAAIKSAGIPAEYLAGAGQLAACIRVAHAIRIIPALADSLGAAI